MALPKPDHYTDYEARWPRLCAAIRMQGYSDPGVPLSFFIASRQKQRIQTPTVRRAIRTRHENRLAILALRAKHAAGE